MTATCPRQWMLEQLTLDRTLCLILGSESELDARHALLNTRTPDQHRNVYRETQACDLADAGPLILHVDHPDDERITELVQVPERNWGWLASIGKDDLPALSQHWRERLITGTRPNQALYRFHDNRVLGRALRHMPEEARPAYLGPAISVCYWHGAGWEIAHNPAPGEHPLPADPPWLNVPVPASLSMEMLQSNIYRYLWAEHSDDLMRLSQRHDPGEWLTEQLSQAQEWGWSAPEQVHFLIISKLNEAEPPLIKNWLPHNGEAPQVHFERLFNEVKFWSGESSV